MDLEEIKVNGIKVNYYFVCKRKLWLFDKGIQMEKTSEQVSMGKLLEEFYCKNVRKDVLIDDLICIDIVSTGNIREVKFSPKMDLADRWQLYYYLFYLDSKGIKRKGIINYPRQKKREVVELTETVKEKLIEILRDIKKIVSLDSPPPIEVQPYCRSCAYYFFCFSG